MNTYSFKVILFLSIAFCFASCQSKTQPDNSAVNAPANNSAVVAPANTNAVSYEMSPSKSKDEAIRKVDFKNFTYEASCASDTPEKVTVKKGEYSRDKEDDKLYFNIMNVTYGDITGDDSDEAIVLSVCNTGGTGQFTEGFVYTLKDGKPVLLTRIEGGDRADGGLREARVENGLLSVERNDNDGSSGACCPEYSVTTKYKWDGKKLVETGKSPRRKLYPETRITFAKGNSESNTKVHVEDIKRYVVGASAGQTLTVSVDSKDVTLSLLSDDADVTDGTNSFSAKLNKNGDYVIQVQNIAEKPTDVNLKIKIE